MSSMILAWAPFAAAIMKLSSFIALTGPSEAPNLLSSQREPISRIPATEQSDPWRVYLCFLTGWSSFRVCVL